MRAWALVLVAGCSWSSDLGVLHGNGGTGGSIGGHVGVGAIQREILVVDGSVRADVASGGSRVALGGSVLGGLPVGKYHVLARAGVWHAATSSRAENAVVPTFELGGFIPLRADPIDPPSKYGWGASGIIFGVREDLDAAALTTVFVGLQLFLIPGY